MGRVRFIIFIAFSFCFFQLQAEEKKLFPDTVTIKQQKLIKIGQGKRKYYWANVYEAALYGHDDLKPASTDKLLKQENPILIRLKYNHKVDLKATQEAWIKSIESNCNTWCEDIKDSKKKFISQVQAIEKDELQDYQFLKTGLKIFKNKKPWIDLEDTTFGQVILMTFIGEHPPTKQLKKDLLGE
ncbi:MAG TPA: chalcone isomerase family protein [Oligoflexia bacterium]|nr:chalcone isomerase family protein [Oligoflexia bacterium]